VASTPKTELPNTLTSIKLFGFMSEKLKS